MYLYNRKFQAIKDNNIRHLNVTRKMNVTEENNIKLNESQKDKCYVFSFISGSRFQIEAKVYMT